MIIILRPFRSSNVLLMPGWEWSGSSHYLSKNCNGYATHTASGKMEFIGPTGSSSRRRNTLILKALCCRVITAGLPASMRQDMGQVTQTSTWRTKVRDFRPGRSLETIASRIERKNDYTDKKYLLEWCSYIEDPPGWSSTRTLATGGQPLICLEVPGDVRVLLLYTTHYRPRH